MQRVTVGGMILGLMAGGLAIAGNLLCTTWTDARGRVFLVDLEQRRVVSHWAYRGDDGGYADAAGVAFGDDFSLYVADTCNDVVRRFTAFGKEVGRIGTPAEGGVGSQRRDRTGKLDRPRAVACRSGIVYVAGGDGRLRRGVQRFATDGDVLPPLRAFGDVEREFGAPHGIHVDAIGILVADTLNGVVQRFRENGTYVGSITVEHADGEVGRPLSVVRLVDGDVAILAGGDRPGLLRHRIHGPSVPLAASVTEHLRFPTALTCDSVGRVYVLDADGTRVHRLTEDLAYDGIAFDLWETVHGGE